MSQNRTEVITCPGCGKNQHFTVWDSVNSEDRDLVGKILSGRLFEFRCKSCGYTADVNYTMLYSDMDHLRFIWLIPPEQASQTRSILGTMPLPGVRQMAVHSKEELAEAIRTVDLTAKFN